MTLSISIIAIIGIFILVMIIMHKSSDRISEQNTRNLVDVAMLSIDNQNKSLNYHVQYSIELRKNERKNIVALVKSILNRYYAEYKSGRLTENQAKNRALDDINKIRYDEDKGYVWINNTEKPVPRVIVHPYFPEFNMKPASAPIFFSSADSSNIFLNAVELCEEQGAGFIEYTWPKPNNSDSVQKEKLSYVELYKPWQWIIGTGIYLEDIERDVKDREMAMIDELKNTLGELRIAQTGYFFIFNGNKRVLLHPVLNQERIDSSYYSNSLHLMDSIIKVVQKGGDTYEYNWLVPGEDKVEYKHKKKVFVEYFEPLNWYVCASIYQEEIDRAVVILSKKLIGFSLLFILFTIILSLLVSERLVRPIRELMSFVNRVKIENNNNNINTSQVPITGSKETRLLGSSIKEMLISIEKQKLSLIQQKLEIEKSKEKLKASENKYKTLFTSSGDAALIFKNFKITECNDRAIKILKAEKEDLIGLSLWEISPEYQPDGISSKDKARELFESTGTNQPVEFEWIYKNLKNELLDIDVTLIFFDEEKKFMLSTWRDVTAKKKAERALKESEEKYKFLVENSPSVFWMVDKERSLKYISPNIENVLGTAGLVFKGKWQELFINRIHAEDRETAIKDFDDLYVKGISINSTYRIKNRKGYWIWVHVLGEKNSTVFGENTAYGVITDITDKKITDQKIMQTMIRSEEKERSRIAKDLHDGVSPLLSAIKLFTQSLHDSKEESLKEQLSEKISVVIGEAIRSIHEISVNISPHILQNFGLIKAVESFASHLTAASNLSIKIESKLKDRLSIEIETTLYRISVELLNNAVKYSKSDQIFINYMPKGNSVYLVYQDNGIGFNTEYVLSQSKGMGLFNMKTRVEALYGKFIINSIENKGTNVIISVPIT